jgi:hypothetical protein
MMHAAFRDNHRGHLVPIFQAAQLPGCAVTWAAASLSKAGNDWASLWYYQQRLPLGARPRRAVRRAVAFED